METQSKTVNVSKMEFVVQMSGPTCVDKVKEVVNSFEGVKLLSICPKSQRLVVEGDVMAERVRSTVEEKTGMSTVMLGYGSTEDNLGAGVAAVRFGTSGVLGMLRLVQNSQKNCIIEGTLDHLPTSKPVYLTVHKSGNVSDGCDSCGDLLSSRQGFNGVLSQLSPDGKQRAEFRVSTSDVKLSDMIGRCVVVHQGEKEEVLQGRSNRLACGIIARASGLFENSKRFCHCDGVTIWEQREQERSGKL